MIPAFDFTSYWITHINDDAALQMVQGGWKWPVIGFDTSEDSRQVLDALVRAGCTGYDAYRFLNWSRPLHPQLDSVRQGVILAYQAGLPLPGRIWLDVEEEFQNTPPAVDVRQALHYCIETMFDWQIGPMGDVKLGIYSGYWFYAKYNQKYGLLNYTEPADRGLLLWTTSTTSDPDRTQLYAGWQQADGVQYAVNQDSPIGQIDLDMFRDRQPAPAPGPAPDPTPPPTPKPPKFISVVATDEDGKEWKIPA